LRLFIPTTHDLTGFITARVNRTSPRAAILLNPSSVKTRQVSSRIPHLTTENAQNKSYHPEMIYNPMKGTCSSN
jgi:hypothetical protein